jgi:hypothetical protein
LLAMATPIIVLPIERIHVPANYSSQVSDDTKLDRGLTKEICSVLGGVRTFSDTPFGVTGRWSYVSAYNPVFNLAHGCPGDLLKALEHFPIRLNRRGFPNQHLSDSSCMLVLEASMHGQSPFERSSAACH